MLKPIIFYVVLVGSVLTVSGQDRQDYSRVKLEKTSDYKEAEGVVLQAATYVLTSAVNIDDTYRIKSLQFLVKWMEGTPDYTFQIDEPIARIGADDMDILGVYMASMVKCSLETKDLLTNPKEIKIRSVKSLLDYCFNPHNAVKITPELKRLKEAERKGHLEKYVGM